MTDNLGDVRAIRIEDEMRVSYLDYAMSVIVARALPDVRDGLKPVHRRILYTMGEMGLSATSSYRKCAAIVGEVMGKYHPHGDVALYDALVRLAQDFSMRYPLVDGQGNFGSVDGDSAAAMRYTEARLTAISAEMLADIDKDTVDYEDNYDGTQKQPTVLPAKLPNLLINGSSGIAVGMATNIPPHHLGEVVDAVVAYIENPEITNDGLCPDRQGPRLPDRRLDLPLRDAAQPADRRAGDDRRDPRDVRPRARPRDHARAVRVRGGPARPHGDHRQRAAVPGEQGDAAREDRRPGQGQEARRHQRPARRVRPRRDADLHRDQARREPAQGAEQPVQAHLDAAVVQPQHARARRRPAPDAAAQERHQPLRHPPPRDRPPPDRVRPREGPRTGPHPRGPQDRPRQPRRGDQDHPRLGGRRDGAQQPHEPASACPSSRPRRSSTCGSPASRPSSARRSRRSTSRSSS